MFFFRQKREKANLVLNSLLLEYQQGRFPIELIDIIYRFKFGETNCVGRALRQIARISSDTSSLLIIFANAQFNESEKVQFLEKYLPTHFSLAHIYSLIQLIIKGYFESENQVMKHALAKVLPRLIAATAKKGNQFRKPLITYYKSVLQDCPVRAQFAKAYPSVFYEQDIISKALRIQVDKLSTLANYERMLEKINPNSSWRAAEDSWIVLTIHPELRADRAFMLEAVKKNGLLLQAAQPTLQDDEELVFEAYKENHQSISYASLRLSSNKPFILKLMQRNGWGLAHISGEFQDDIEVVSIAVLIIGLALQYASARVKDNEQVVSLAINNHPLALQYASLRLKDKLSVVFLAVKQFKATIRYASPRLKEHPHLNRFVDSNLSPAQTCERLIGALSIFASGSLFFNIDLSDASALQLLLPIMGLFFVATLFLIEYHQKKLAFEALSQELALEAEEDNPLRLN